MTQRSFQRVQEGLQAFGQELEQLAQACVEWVPVFLEPVLIQVLMLSVDFLPKELQPPVRQVIDTARVLKGELRQFYHVPGAVCGRTGEVVA